MSLCLLCFLAFSVNFIHYKINIYSYSFYWIIESSYCTSLLSSFNFHFIFYFLFSRCLISINDGGVFILFVLLALWNHRGKKLQIENKNHYYFSNCTHFCAYAFENVLHSELEVGLSQFYSRNQYLLRLLMLFITGEQAGFSLSVCVSLHKDNRSE